ncbi:hypothetical protein [Cronobacter dublinensis]|uniref:hypothetical protein n=1 Tax=Cronobacter dublinensis TaxID=413497 RepID=UPI001375A362|nr:hypothetical protein [Cronobacter dublinensis]NCH59557.1 hypothetical protein [Cronobacter dublinensis]
MKKLIYLLGMLTFQTLAGDFPVVTSVRPEYQGNNSWNYYITQKIMDVGPSVDVVPTTGEVILGHRHNPHNDDVFNATYNYWIVQANGKDSIGKMALHLYTTYGARRTYILHQGDDYGKDECVGYVYSTENNKNGVPWATVRPPVMCMNVPPPDEWCLIKTPELLIDHGIISLKDAEGHSASTNLRVDCSNQIAVEFTLIGDEPYVYLKPSGKSEIKVDGKPLKNRIDLPTGSSTLKIEDLLTGVTAEGVNTGSSVLIMMPY